MTRTDEFPGQQRTINLDGPRAARHDASIGTSPILDYSPLTIEKSNIMMLGPSGVGKTLMAKYVSFPYRRS